MSKVLERKVIHPGKTFIRAGEEHYKAYMVQNGLVRSFIMDGENKVEVAEYGPGKIFAETCLMIDEPMTMSYEAVEDTTVAAISRQDFMDKIKRVDQDVMTILENVMNKLNYQDVTMIDEAKKNAKIDPDALALVQVFVKDLSDDKKFMYEKAILPHLNAMIKAIKKLKGEGAE